MSEKRVDHPDSAKYKTASEVLRVVSVVGWCGVVAGALLASAIFEDSGMSVFLAAPAALSILGLMLVVASQASSAIIDTANSARNILEELRTRPKT